MVTSVVVVAAQNADRAAFSAALQGTQFRVVADADRGERLSGMVERWKPGIVSVDLDIPGGGGRPGDGGVVAVRDLTDRHPGVPVMVTHDASTAPAVPLALRAGGSVSVKRPYDRATLVETLELLNNPRGEMATRRLIAARFRKSLAVSYKAAGDGIFVRKRTAVTSEIGLTGLEVRTEEALTRGQVLIAEIALPGVPLLRAKLQVTRAEAVPGIGQFEAALSWHEMTPHERERLKAWCRETIARGSDVPIVRKAL